MMKMIFMTLQARNIFLDPFLMNCQVQVQDGPPTEHVGTNRSVEELQDPELSPDGTVALLLLRERQGEERGPGVIGPEEEASPSDLAVNLDRYLVETDVVPVQRHQVPLPELELLQASGDTNSNMTDWPITLTPACISPITLSSFFTGTLG